MGILLGAFLRKRREQLNLSLKDVVLKMNGFTVADISGVERGQVSPTEIFCNEVTTPLQLKYEVIKTLYDADEIITKDWDFHKCNIVETLILNSNIPEANEIMALNSLNKPMMEI